MRKRAVVVAQSKNARLGYRRSWVQTIQVAGLFSLLCRKTSYSWMYSIADFLDDNGCLAQIVANAAKLGKSWKKMGLKMLQQILYRNHRHHFEKIYPRLTVNYPVCQTTKAIHLLLKNIGCYVRVSIPVDMQPSQFGRKLN